MATTKFSEVRKRNPVSPEVQAEAHLLNLAEHTGVPLAELRRLTDLTQIEVARRLAVTQPTVSEFERGANPAAVATVQRYVEALGARLEVVAVFEDGRRVLLDV